MITPNGAGKSTALKLLTRILKPTHGPSTVCGRVRALIEHRSTDLLCVYSARFTAEEVGAREIHPGEEITLEFQLNANVVRG